MTTYTYNANGLPVEIADASGKTTTYQYDALNRLTGINKLNSEIITYQYDSRGNRTQASVCEIYTSNFVPSEYEYNCWDELSQISTNGETLSFEYDSDGVNDY